MFNSVWKMTSVLALVALTTASAEAKPPQGGPVQPPMVLTVVCPADSIQAAVDQAVPGTLLTITVDGTCTEEVVITTDDVTIQGNNIVDDHVIGGFTITGAHRVTIKSLTIRDGTLSYPVGVFASRGAAVVLDDIFVSGQGGAGIYVNRNAHADILGSTVENPASGDNALLINDGAAVRASNSTFSSANGASNTGAAVGLYRSASARFDGDNFFENDGGGLAIEILHTSNLRVQGGANLVSGNVFIGNNSAASLREVDVNGDIMVHGDSNLNLRAKFSPVTVDGFVFLGDQSLLAATGFGGNLSITGHVTCAGPAGGVVNPGVINGSINGGCSTF
jgi:hypothetical protein